MRALLIASILATASAFLATPAFANGINVIKLDEVFDSVFLFPPVVTGSVELCEQPGPGLHCGFFGPSDFVVFSNNRIPTATLYSVECPTNPGHCASGQPADARFDQVQGIVQFPVNVVAEGNPTIYTPGPNDPGGGAGFTYEIFSDPPPPAVPEPSTLALAVPGMLPFALAYLKQRGRSRSRAAG